HVPGDAVRSAREDEAPSEPGGRLGRSLAPRAPRIRAVQCEIPAPTPSLRSTLARVSLLLSPPLGGCMSEAAMRSALQPLGRAIPHELRSACGGDDGVRHRPSHLRVHPKIDRTTMTAKETRACLASFLLHNEPMSSMRDEGVKERPPFFFVGTGKL